MAGELHGGMALSVKLTGTIHEVRKGRRMGCLCRADEPSAPRRKVRCVVQLRQWGGFGHEILAGHDHV